MVDAERTEVRTGDSKEAASPFANAGLFLRGRGVFVCVC